MGPIQKHKNKKNSDLNRDALNKTCLSSYPPPLLQTWSGPERLVALDELIDRCETGQVKHMMQVIEPQFQRDFISLLPKEVPACDRADVSVRSAGEQRVKRGVVVLQLALYVLTFLAPRDLLQAAQTCRYWRILAEDNLLWREKCREEGKHRVHQSRMKRAQHPLYQASLTPTPKLHQACLCRAPLF